MRINRLTSVAIIAATSFSTVAIGEARAQSAASTETEIAALKRQLLLMEQKLDALQKQTAANTTAAAKANAKADAKVTVTSANAAIPVKAAVAPSGVVVTMPNNRPTICTADDQNCIAITSRVHFDVGGYDYRPNTAATTPQRLDDGVNVRRARIGVIGKFFGDWNYALIYDFGGASDGFASTASVGGAAVGFLPGGALSGIENAYLSYTGIKPFGGKLAIEGGVMDLPYTLDEASSSNDLPFMERASSGITATNIAAGDFRSAFGARWYTDTFWAGAYVTGPATGAIHSASSINPPGTTEQYGVIARAADAFAPLPSVKFKGGYAEAAYVLTGETRPYNSAAASYGGIAPANPFSLTGGGWGAWEIAGRFSTIDLNDQLAAANGVAGGRQTIYTLALNWYVNRNVRLMFDYLHGDITKQISPTNFGDAGAKFDAVAMRTQVAF